MSFLILLVAILFALISVGVGVLIVNRKSYSFRDSQINSTILKIGSIILILMNVQSFINRAKNIFSLYS